MVDDFSRSHGPTSCPSYQVENVIAHLKCLICKVDHVLSPLFVLMKVRVVRLRALFDCSSRQ